MSPDQLRKVEELFHHACSLDPAERPGFLRTIETEDRDVAREVRALLEFEKDDDKDSSPGPSPAEIAAVLMPPDSDLAANNEVINQYKILRLLGEGGMGRVYLARDEKLERLVAIKILDPEVGRDVTRRTRFFREAKSASALNHPNILTVHEIGETEAGQFIVTEYIDGQTLREFLQTKNPPATRRLEIAGQIASALAAAHDAGIIHRDIKPDNVMIRHDGIVKILDFGIAKLVGESPRAPHVSAEEPTVIGMPPTTPGMIIGTPQYMSPEQARGGHIDARSDIFSFGVVLYEMLTGRLPFNGSSNADIIGSILRDEPLPVRSLNDSMPPEIDPTISKSLSKDREARYQSMGELLADLNEVQRQLTAGGLTQAVTAEFGETPSVSRTAAATLSGFSEKARFSLFQLVVSIMLAGLVGVAVWYFFATKQTPIQSVNSASLTDLMSWASIPDESYSSGAFSPDGKMIAFTSTKSGHRSIWIKQVAGGEPIQVTKDDFDNEQPVWSPTGEEIAFFSTRGNRTGIWRTPTLGGAPKFIATIADGTALLRQWSRDGVIYFDADGALQAVIVNSDGQIRTVFESAPELPAASSLTVAPDGKSVAFVSVQNDRWTVSVSSLPAGKPLQILVSASEIKNLVWRADKPALLFSQLVNGTFQVFTVGADGGSQARQLTFGDRDIFALDAAADGKRLLLGSAKEDSDIWQLDLATDKETVFAADISFELWAAIANDGQSVAYQSVKTMSQGNNLVSGRIISRRFDRPDSASDVAAQGYLPVWSPDSTRIAYLAVAGSTHNLMIAPAGGGPAVTAAAGVMPPSYSILPYNRLEVSDIAWTPDGSRITYVARVDGVKNIFSVKSDGTEKSQLTTNTDPRTSFYAPIWSADGNDLAFITKSPAAGGKPTFAVAVRKNSGEIAELTRIGKFLRLLGWQKESGRLLVVTTDESESTTLHPEVSVVALHPMSGEMSEITKLKNVYLANIHLAPDGRSLAFVANNNGHDDVWLMPLTAGAGSAKKMTSNNDARLYFSSLAFSPNGQRLLYGKQSRYSILSTLTDF